MAHLGSQLAVAYELVARETSHAWVVFPDTDYRPVKNLGYVFRNWKRIHSMAWIFVDKLSGILLVRFTDLSLFATHYTSWQTAHTLFFHRPIFQGIKVTVYFPNEQIAGYFVAGKSFAAAKFDKLPNSLIPV